MKHQRHRVHATEARPVRPVRLRIRRQDGPEQPETARWEEFELEGEPGMTIADALRALEQRPLTRDGVAVPPVVWECGCQQEACGSCAMLINRQARLACAVSIDEVAPRRGAIELAPLSKFPVIRDLVVDRARIERDRLEQEVWIPSGVPELAQPLPAATLPMSTLGAPTLGAAVEHGVLPECLDCGCCLEACPEYGSQSDYVGASVIHRVHTLNLLPLGQSTATRRLELLMRPGGIVACGFAQNCASVCPVSIPLVDSLQRVARATSRRLWRDWLLG